MNSGNFARDGSETPEDFQQDGPSTSAPQASPKSQSEPGPEQRKPATAGIASPTDEILRLTQERDDLKEQLLRARADFINYQRRAKQQADEIRAYAAGSLAGDLLEPLDNLDRAIAALRDSGVEGITAGLEMVQRQLLDILAKHGVEPISAHGEPFDPNLHDAMLQQPSDQHPEGTVVAELGKGYKIRDRVLRPSKVAVSVKPKD
jgi:molecular chaperone GrpE